MQDKPKANGSENDPNDLEHGVVEVFVCVVLQKLFMYRSNII